jgi:hypothetical protein
MASLQPLLDSIRAAVQDENWHAALALTLTLPDICARIETGKRGKRRYINWWKDNFRHTYAYGSGASDHVTGEEVYLLRCAYLHQGSDSLDPADRQNLNALIENFNFVISNDHLKKQGTTVLLNVRTFCLDMCSRVEGWEKNILSNSPYMQARAEKLSKIYLPLRISAAVMTSAAITIRLMRQCAKCGKIFPQEEHESLCGDCRWLMSLLAAKEVLEIKPLSLVNELTPDQFVWFEIHARQPIQDQGLVHFAENSWKCLLASS